MQIYFPTIRENSRAHCKKCSRLVLVKNTLQLVMENWEKRSKAELQNRVVYISLHQIGISLVRNSVQYHELRKNLGRRGGVPNIAITLG